MSFTDSYKKLEKLCSDMYGELHGISEYISDMESKSDGKYLVPNWNDDYRNLKHYRYVRNKIVHEPGYTEENMCSYGDSRWLDDFYLRIMHRTDPLALYKKAKNRQNAQKQKETKPHDFVADFENHGNFGDYSSPQNSQLPLGCFILIAIGILLLAILLVALQ